MNEWKNGWKNGWCSLLRRGSKGFFSGGVDLLSNVSAGTELQATAEVLHLINPFNFVPAVHFAQRIDIANAWTSAEERVADKSLQRVDSSVPLMHHNSI